MHLDRRRARQLLLAGAGALGIGSLATGLASAAGMRALVSPRPASHTRPVPATLLSCERASDGRFLLTMSGPGAQLVGWVGISLDDGRRLLAGPAVAADGGSVRTASVLAGGSDGLPGPGEVQVTPDPWVGSNDPLRLGEQLFEVGTPEGPLAVTSCGDRDASRAVVFVHGRGGRRTTGWWFAAEALATGRRLVLPAYRNDPGEGPTTGGYLLGGEWCDLAAVLDHLASEGVRETVLIGWSMGGAICAGYLRARHRDPQRFSHHPAVTGLVLDAAALDWGPVLGHVAGQRRLPSPLVPAVMAYGQLRAGTCWQELNHLADPAHLRLPIVAFHGERDDVVPVELSRRLASSLPQVELHTMADAGHCRAINQDPEFYLAQVRPLLAARQT
jgi:pimeloyl-ACP methyl ester carboxylesterase